MRALSPSSHTTKNAKKIRTCLDKQSMAVYERKKTGGKVAHYVFVSTPDVRFALDSPAHDPGSQLGGWKSPIVNTSLLNLYEDQRLGEGRIKTKERVNGENVGVARGGQTHPLACLTLCLGCGYTRRENFMRRRSMSGAKTPVGFGVFQQQPENKTWPEHQPSITRVLHHTSVLLCKLCEGRAGTHPARVRGSPPPPHP